MTHPVVEANAFAAQNRSTGIGPNIARKRHCYYQSSYYLRILPLVKGPAVESHVHPRYVRSIVVCCEASLVCSYMLLWIVPEYLCWYSSGIEMI